MLLTTLSPVLSRYPSRFQPISSVEALGGAGGLSGALLWRYQSQAGPMLIRAWPEGRTRESVESVHGWLRAADLDFLALPVAASDGGTVATCAGRLWQVEPWMSGKPDLADLPSVGHVDAAFSGLAVLHGRLAVQATEGTSPGIAAAARETEALLESGFDRIESALGRFLADELHPVARRWLSLARTLAPGFLPRLRDAARLRVALQPCLRDARPEHFLFEGDRLTGLVDYGAMGIETVAADLARLMGEWMGGHEPLRASAMSCYESVRACGESERALVTAFESAADLLIGAHWLRWYLLEHRRFEDPQSVARGLTRGLARLTRPVGPEGSPGIVV
jgi:homoserine kinase type II